MLADAIRAEGYATLARVLMAREVESLRDHLARDVPPNQAGVRGLLGRSAAVRALAGDRRIRQLVEPVLGPRAHVVRSIFFNKTPQANWQVAWHQDLTIAVCARHAVDGYGPWSVKDGVPHVQPPVAVLEQMLTLRLHLDETDEDNGALWVAPGSHTAGRIDVQSAARMAQERGPVACPVVTGGAMLFRPLLLHASRKSASARTRRVIHLEFAAAALPGPLAWYEAGC